MHPINQRLMDCLALTGGFLVIGALITTAAETGWRDYSQKQDRPNP